MEYTTNKTWDAIVIGTGPAGATVARELSINKKNVLILEKGTLDLSINIPKMLKNKEMLFIGKGKTMVRGIRTGGTSVFYYGTAYDPPIDIFAKFSISLASEVQELKKELPIAPLRDDLIGSTANAVMRSATDLGYAWKKLDKIIFQDKCTSGNFPVDAQWNSLQWVNEAVQSGAQLVNGANVTKVLRNGREAVGVEFVTQGKQHKVYASKIILSAGGLGSPVILHSSGLRDVGNGFFCDPLVMVQGELDGIKAGNEIPMATGMVFDDDGYIMTDLTLPKMVFQLFAAQRLRFDRLFSHDKTVTVMVKVRDSIGGKITKEGRVLKEFSKDDKYKMQHGLERAKAILINAGAQRVYYSNWTSAHPGGSVRIGEGVDSNLQSEYKNLYVCDSSVIPCAWGLPPTLTVMALGKRLAKHVISEL